MINFLNGSNVKIIIVCIYLINSSTCKPEAELQDNTKYNDLNAEKCSRKREGCCQNVEFADEKVLMKCLMLHHSKMPAEEEDNAAKSMTYLTCMMECIFKQQKIAGIGDTINMKMVNLFAEKEYANRPKEKKYYIDTLERCRQEGLTEYNLVRNTPSGNKMMKHSCNPYFLFVFLCRVNYQEEVSCPYFKWSSHNETPSDIDCEKAKQKCYQIDGITI